MSEFQRRFRELTTRLSQWWSTSARSAREHRAADLRKEAAARAQKAASRVQDFRQSERGQRAASKLNDLRTSETAKKAEAAFKDLRASETGRKAESALADLRQREPVKKAEESARKVLHDLFSGGGSGSSTTTGTSV
ncbi:MAG TPA: hypothetical protein VHF26_08030 [Trebonia sp.]|nr:hypothetical protein [Trebonia sp.]